MSLTRAELASIIDAYAEAERRINMATAPDWQAGRHELRSPEQAVITPSFDEMAAKPGTTQTQFRVTYERVGRHGGCDGSQPPAPLTVWAISADGLAEHVHHDVLPYLASSDVEVSVNLQTMTGRIFAGCNNGGSFTIEQLTKFCDLHAHTIPIDAPEQDALERIRLRDERIRRAHHLLAGACELLELVMAPERPVASAAEERCSGPSGPGAQEPPSTECATCGDTGCRDQQAEAHIYCRLCNWPHAEHRFMECATFTAS
ncbi:hypothetical protein ABR737_01355 [Streptomyces sp. Edi2]|uniref:hypothetical protein n=1 Tax=Streptomyces sp. Edi2 TaxID=3162528 RepID=UPI00330633D7